MCTSYRHIKKETKMVSFLVYLAFFAHSLRSTQNPFLVISFRLNLVSSFQKPFGFLHSDRFAPLRHSLRSAYGNYAIAFSTATATATVAPTIGLLPIPITPIISTCAGTEDEPANCASLCILPIVSVIP